MKKILYFAYGSNLVSERLISMVELFGKVVKVSNHRLYGWKLVFNASPFRGKPYANIVEGTANDFVDGVLYDLNPAQYSILDRYEALYYRYYFDLPNGRLLCTYICTDKGNLKEGKPYLDYLNTILDGCLENNLTGNYNKLLAYKLENYKLKTSKHK